MFGKRLFVSMMLVGISACARPVYENQPSGRDNLDPQKESLAACSVQFKESGNCLSWKWDQEPTDSAAGTLSFKIYRLNAHDGTPVEIDPASTPVVVLWMPSMGHGSSPTKTSRMDVGTFSVTNVYFVMPGEWEIKFQIRNGSTVVDEAVVPLTI